MNDHSKLIRTALSLALCLWMQNHVAVWSAETPGSPEVLPAETIFGNAKISYLAAKKVPDICAKLFCYCGCDSTDNHKSLLDCFTSEHGVDCSICQEEAIMALKMKEEGKTLAQIQKVVDQKYVADYNSVFSQPGEMLLAYRKERLWKPTAAEALRENTIGKEQDSQAQEKQGQEKQSQEKSGLEKLGLEKLGSTGKPGAKSETSARRSTVKSKPTSQTASPQAKKTGSCCGHAH